MQTYLNFLQHVLDNGDYKSDRTNTGTYSVFGYQSRYNLKDGFPLLTTKKVHLKAIIHELLWFIKGDTNIQYLVKNNVRIWNEWPYETFKKSSDYNNESLDVFINKIATDDEFAQKHGDLGPIYGKQWRDFGGIDQLSNLIDDLKNNPNSRRLIISAWNPPLIKDMSLPPCHAFMQFYVSDNQELSCQLYQRSADLFLGVPFNIASYSLLTMMLAQVTGLKLGDFIHTIGDAHIYLNHIEQVEIQLSRQPKVLPKISINNDITSIFDFTFDDFTLEEYDPYPTITAKVAV